MSRGIAYGYCATCGRVGTHDIEPDGALNCVDWRACLAYRDAQREWQANRETRTSLGIPEVLERSGVTP